VPRKEIKKTKAENDALEEIAPKKGGKPKRNP